MSVRRRRGSALFKGVCVVIAASVLAVVVGQSASQANFPKNYTIAAAPAQLARGKDIAVTVTVTNTSIADNFNGVKVTVPAGYAIVGMPTASSGTVTALGDVIEVQHANVATGAALTITQTVNVACTASPGPSTWVSDVRLTDDFNASDNKLTLVGLDALTTVTDVPCNGSLANCTAGDGQACGTGDFVSPAGNVANVVVNDTDTVTGTLEAAFTGTTVQCDEYLATSERLKFGMTITNGVNPSGLTKRVTITQPVDPAKSTILQYYACFQSPNDFEALLPSQLPADFDAFDFTNNTQPVSTTTGIEHKGLLLPCAVGLGVPCADKKYFNGNGTVTMELLVAVGDPFVSF